MCIIIDTNKAHEFCIPSSAEAGPIHEWLNRGGTVVYCATGKYEKELGNSKKFKDKMKELSQRGRADLIETAKVNTEELKLKGVKICKSNDVHILALAKASGARLLYTADNSLMRDFKNKKIINNPPGKIYTNDRNRDLLKKNTCNRS